MKAVEPPLDLSDLNSVIREAHRAGAGWAEVFVERRHNETLRLDSGEIAEVRNDRDLGAGIRGVTNGRAGLAFTNILTRRSLREAARVAAAASGANGSAGPSAAVIDLRDRLGRVVQHSFQPSGEASIGDKCDRLLRVDDAARRRHPAITAVSAVYVAVVQHVWVATSDGSLAHDQRIRTRITCRATASADGRVATGFVGPGVGAGMELYDWYPPEDLGARAADRAVAALSGAAPPTGRMPIVLGPSGGGLLIHEACGHGLEADGLARGSSVFATCFGRAVGSPLITVIDDPTLVQRYGSYGIDDEGQTAAATTLLNEGRLVGALTDREHALGLATACARSANARRESYAHPPIPRMSNTYIAPQGSVPTSIIASVDNGVYIASLKGGDVNIASGDFAFAASEAYLIEGGQVTSPLAGLTVLGNGATALDSATAVGDDLEFTQALCGKDGQWVPVSYGSPTIRLDGLTISGGHRH